MCVWKWSPVLSQTLQSSRHLRKDSTKNIRAQQRNKPLVYSREMQLVSVGGDGARPVILFHHFLHEADVVVLGKLSVFQEVGTFVLRHCLDKMLDNFVWNKGVSQIQFRDIGL